VAGVARGELLADLLVGPLPEALEVVGDLLWSAVGGQQVKQYRDPAAPQARRRRQAEELLDARREDRPRWVRLVESDLVAGGDREALGCFAVEGDALGVGEGPEEGVSPGGAAQLFEGPRAADP
jgi:hypothetical protein